MKDYTIIVMKDNAKDILFTYVHTLPPIKGDKLMVDSRVHTVTDRIMPTESDKIIILVKPAL
jgi:hypothetical protein